MKQPGLDARNVNSLWCGVLAETLVRCGVTQAVLSPGSRSTPLVFALARHPSIEALSVLDERSAAFFALGLAKKSCTPVVLVCTSGTAGANYYPAVIEAHEAGVPLIVITADRPPEMRECSSGQTIDQQKLFGSYVEFYHELAVPVASEPMLAYLRQTVAHAAALAMRDARGPVHLNAPFRDPLPPIADDGATAQLAGAIDWNVFFKHLDRVTTPCVAASSFSLPESQRGIIVVGPSQPDDRPAFANHVGEISRRLGWPVLAEGLTPLRGYASRIPALITTYDAILRQPELARSLKPDAVLCLGGWPTSKVLRNWLGETDPEIILVSENPANGDALHGRTRQVQFSLESLAECFEVKDEISSFTQNWKETEARVRAKLDAALRDTVGLFEPRATWLLAENLPAGTPLFVANSMPVRDVEYFWPANELAIELYFNRGANGIDGTLSSALGLAHGGKPTVLLTGDLALLHDTNGFLSAAKLRGSLTIVLINNNGGGIFEHLPVAQFDPPFEEFFATPQHTAFDKLCATYGVGYVAVRDWAHFTTLVETLPLQGVRVLEVRTDRKRDVAIRKNLLNAAAK